MRKVSKIFVATLLLIFLMTINALAIDVTMVDNGHWNYAKITSELTEKVKIVILYFHGSGNTGSRLNDLKVLMGKQAADNPVKYATVLTDEEWLPPGVVIVCPQAHNDKDFHENQDEILWLIEQQEALYPDAKIVLAGHSNGAMAMYRLAQNYPDIADAWIFISGKSINSQKLSSDMCNVFVASGIGEINSKIGLAKRMDFANLFYSKLTTEISAWKEEDSHNAYMVGEWSHGQTPRVFLESFFWEWIAELC